MHPGACHEREVLWAERVRALIPSAECVRFTASGSESTALAVRLARALTGRDLIVKFEGHFHGWLDHAVNAIDVPFETPWTRGVPEAVRALTRVLPANNLALVEQALSSGDVAAVILEPTGASGGSVPLAEGFLDGLRELCTRFGTKLIFDEVITGFRVAPGGVQDRFHVFPDITCLAKVLAGGMPGGAVCGPKESFAPMQFSGDGAKDRSRRVAQYGTFNASPVSAAAGNAMLRLVEGGAPCRAAEAFTTQLKRRLNALFKAEGLPFAAYGFSSVFHLFTAEPAAAELLRDGEIDAVQISADRLKKKGALDALLRRALLLEGVDLPPGRQAWISAAHGDEELEETVDAFTRAIHALRELGCL
jgi:glutamate-1-semialdehyde 2,1-aminomutase